MKRFIRFLVKSVLWFFLLSIVWVIVYGYVNVPATPLMAIRYFEEENPPQKRHDWVPIENISIHLQKAVICAEDQSYVSHNGFDIAAIKKARENNKEGKKLKGGSTISQQTAKNIFLWPQRSWIRKGLETYFTFLIETFWSKERILEVYLNSIEYGPGIYGAEAASQYWFDTSASMLTVDQAAALASILPSPRKYSANPATPYVVGRKQWVKQQMKNYGPLSLSQAANEDISKY
ncbi:MAG: monofunctional biosynthetic peptidoglycan transglycosylase [Gilvibacter sp.]